MSAEEEPREDLVVRDTSDISYDLAGNEYHTFIHAPDEYPIGYCVDVALECDDGDAPYSCTRSPCGTMTVVILWSREQEHD